MIARLTGVLAHREPGRVILDVGGVGYEAIIPLSTYEALPASGQTVTLRVHTHAREDALILFGFLTDREKSLFERLIGVSGVGPKLAITLLSGLSPGEIARAIRAGDVPALQKTPGIGRKTAERIVVELRDRLGVPDDALAGPGGESPGDPVEDAVSALVNLGYRDTDAREAVRRSASRDGGGDPAALGVDGLLRRALARLSSSAPRPS